MIKKGVGAEVFLVITDVSDLRPFGPSAWSRTRYVGASRRLRSPLTRGVLRLKDANLTSPLHLPGR